MACYTLRTWRCDAPCIIEIVYANVECRLRSLCAAKHAPHQGTLFRAKRTQQPQRRHVHRRSEQAGQQPLRPEVIHRQHGRAHNQRGGGRRERLVNAWVDKYFGRIPKVTTPLVRVDVKEPARTAEQRYTVTAPNVPLPAVVITYLGPSERETDSAALRVAEAILSAGESSRLYQKLVYEQQVAQEAEFSTDLREDLGLLIFEAILASGKTPEEGEKALLAELKRIQDQPVSQAEIDKAKNQLLTGKLHEIETAEGKGLALGHAAVILGNPDRANTDIQDLQAVTAADVQRVMRKYFTDTNRVVITYLPQTEAPAAGGDSK